MHPSIEQELAAIRADRAHGAAQLAERAIRLLARACARSEGRPAEEFLPQMAGWVRRVRALRPSMAAPGN